MLNEFDAASHKRKLERRALELELAKQRIAAQKAPQEIENRLKLAEIQEQLVKHDLAAADMGLPSQRDPSRPGSDRSRSEKGWHKPYTAAEL